MTDMPLWEHIFAYITLGLLCGWYHFLISLNLTLLYFTIRGSYTAGAVILVFIILSILPLRHEPWNAFMNSWIFRVSFDLQCHEMCFTTRLLDGNP
jgi:hypothetical protein